VIDAVLLQPWFLPKRIADAIVGMVPPGFHKKMRYYFDDYGCMICGRDTRYHSNGMCMVCYCRVLRRLKKSVKRRAPKKPDKRLDLVLFRQQKLAKSLLQDFVPPDKTAAKRLT